MKKIYSFIVSGSLFISLHAQTFDWAKAEGKYAYDYGYGITTDNSGNVYAAGKYEELAIFSGTTLPCEGNHDIWVAQYSSSGNLNWIRTAGGISGDYATGVACGNSSVYVCGEFEEGHGLGDTTWFAGTSTYLVCEGSNDIFLAKYDLSGNLLWARRAGGTDYEKALSVTYDQSGNVYMCGLYRGAATFGGTTTINPVTVGVNDMFVAKYDANGTFLWVMSAGSSGRDEAKSIKCDNAGNVYISGLYSNGCVFPGQPALSTYNNTNFYDAFVAKISPAGVVQWIKTGGGDVDDAAWSLTMDDAGKIYIAGEFNAFAPFDGINLTSLGGADMFVACYDASGNVQWAIRAGGLFDDRARGIGCNGTDLAITGQFGFSAALGSFILTAADSSDIFFAGLNNAGTFLRAASVGGAADAYEDLGYESGNAICVDASGTAYATGALLDGGVFGGATLSAYSRTDVFITKISFLTSVNDLANNNINIPVYPNPGTGNFTLDLNQLASQKTETKIFNCLGQVVDTRTDKPCSELTIDLSAQEKGIYFIEIKSEDQSTSRGKIILQ